MTMEEIVSDVMDRLNLTSLEAQTRVERRLNRRYRRVIRAIGMQTSRRAEFEIECDFTDPDTQLPLVVVPDCLKVFDVRMQTPTGGVRRLTMRTYEELKAKPTKVAEPTEWAVQLMGPTDVTILLNNYLEDEPFTLYMTVDEIVIDMEAGGEPAFPEDFHDVLIEGVLADEYRKMEKEDKYQVANAEYERILSDLKFYIAKNGFLDMVQGQTRPKHWWKPWF